MGRSVKRQLVASGRKVLSLSHANEFNVLPDGISLDLTNDRHYEQLADYSKGCEGLIHLAGRVEINLGASVDDNVAPRAIANSAHEIYQYNVVMTARVAEFALTAEIPHILLASSQTVYGLPLTDIVTENAPLVPLEYYAASKIACEAMLNLWARGNARKATVLRFPGIWGPQRRSGLVHTLCKQAVEMKAITIGADYPLPLDVLHCDDVAAAFDAAIDRPGTGFREYNVGTGEFCSLDCLAADIADLVPGCTIRRSGVTQPLIALDVRRATDELNWRARPRKERLANHIELMRQGAISA